MLILPLKDIYMSFLLIAMIGIFHLVKEESNKYLFVASAGLFVTLFHGALVLGLMDFLSLIVLINFKNLFKSIRLLHLSWYSYNFDFMYLYFYKFSFK